VIVFQYAPEIVSRFSDLTAAVALVQDVHNGPAPDALQARYQDQKAAAIERWRDTPLREVPALDAWRRAFREFDVKPTQYRSAPEALLRRLKKQGDIPSISAVVDLMNWVSIKYAMPVAAFNTEHLQLPITVRFARGDERYTPLGGATVQNPEPGEVVFADQTDLVVARRWCWRQSDESAVRPKDKNIIVTIEAHHSNNRPEIESAMTDLETLLGEYVGGRFDGAILDADQTSLDVPLI
jgi:DNA/RNA-binding domain of Phe-tRNA-synthetase-like protein